MTSFLGMKGDKVPGTLPASFYERESTAVAKDLLGKILLVRSQVRRPLESPRALVTAGRIVETEAYRGSDPASHSCRGRTPRSALLFGPPGLAYVYFIYGNYEMLNCVAEPDGLAGAVLIRAVSPLFGEALMERRRGGLPRTRWTDGPGKLCRAMGVKMAHKGQTFAGPALYVTDDGFRPDKAMTSPRVGISAGRSAYWRYFIAGDPFVSRAPEDSQARPLKW